MLSAADLAGMRDTLDESLPDTAIIQRKTRAGDGQGGGTETWAAVGTVPCRVSPVETRGDDESIAGDRTLQTVDYVITVPQGTDVRAVDRLVSGGVTYEVVKVKGPRSWELARRVDVVQID